MQKMVELPSNWGGDGSMIAIGVRSLASFSRGKYEQSAVERAP
jgi:hypothetical protein